MKDLIFNFVNRYATWGILLVVLLAAFLLWRMHRQLKRLNRNLGAITGKIQEYFDVILEEEESKELESVPAARSRKEDWEVTDEERRLLLTRKNVRNPEDEEVFNAVMQEYFS